MEFLYPAIGICGLSCRLCPHYHTEGTSRCEGCKTESRMGAGCPFITCAIKKQGVEFCHDCKDSAACGRWAKHREAGKIADSFKCYQTLEQDIAVIQEQGIGVFETDQRKRESLLKEMLDEFNDGRSKSYYCIAVTVMRIDELETALQEARSRAGGSADRKDRSKILHAILDRIAMEREYLLKLRKRN